MNGAWIVELAEVLVSGLGFEVEVHLWASNRFKLHKIRTHAGVQFF